MEIITKAFKVNSYRDIEEFNILLKDDEIDGDMAPARYQIELAKKRLLYEQDKIINILKKI